MADQAQDLADGTRRPVKVVHGGGRVDGKPEHFPRILAKFAPGLRLDSFVWAALPEPLPASACPSH